MKTQLVGAQVTIIVDLFSQIKFYSNALKYLQNGELFLVWVRNLFMDKQLLRWSDTGPICWIMVGVTALRKRTFYKVFCFQGVIYRRLGAVSIGEENKQLRTPRTLSSKSLISSLLRVILCK